MKAHQADYPVSRLCTVLGLSRSGYYAWSKRSPSDRARDDEQLATRIEAIHAASRGTYGAPRIHAELAAEGIRVGRKRVARLMRERGLQGVSRRKGCKTTIRGRERHEIPDLVDRDFSATEVDQLWVSDITYVPTLAGFVFLAVVLDAFSRRIVGWSMATHLRTSLVLDALEMALHRRRPRNEVIHHSDQGCQYTSIAFGKRCKKAGVRPSVGSVGDCYDNAICESFFATLECELIDEASFQTKSEAKMAVFSFIEGWYNPHRRHSALGYRSPVAFERDHLDSQGRPTRAPLADPQAMPRSSTSCWSPPRTPPRIRPPSLSAGPTVRGCHPLLLRVSTRTGQPHPCSGTGSTRPPTSLWPPPPAPSSFRPRRRRRCTRRRPSGGRGRTGWWWSRVPGVSRGGPSRNTS